MNNDTNNLNGEVLGSVNANPPMDAGNASAPDMGGNVINPDVVNPAPQPEVIQPQVVEPQPVVQPEPVQVEPVVNPEVIPNPVPQTPVNPEVIPNNPADASVVNPTPVSEAPIEPTAPQVAPANSYEAAAQPQAYTNPNTISPMPGFEPTGNIGTTPPISLDKEQAPKKKPNTALFVILILALLGALGFGVYYVLNYTNLIKNNSQVSVVVNNVEVKVGDTLSTNIDDYAKISGTDSKNCSLDISEVDVSTAGNYSFKVTCGENVKTGIVVVTDDSELVVNTKTVYKTKGSTLEASEFILNADSNLTYSFVNEDEVSTAINGDYGTYTVKILAVDANDKNVTVEANLVVMQYDVKGTLICTSNEQNVDSTMKMTVANTFVIVDDGNNGFGNISSEIHTFIFTDEMAYNTYKEQGSSVTINEVTGVPVFDDSNLTIKITNEKDASSEYESSVLQNYGSIRSYFTDTLGYTCSFNKN